MTNDEVIELLRNYNSYKYALRYCGQHDTGLSLMKATRLHGNLWDGTRYSRIVEMVDGALEELLTEDQRIIVTRLHINIHKLSKVELADELHRDRGTITRWHNEALRRLCVALAPLSNEEREIHNLDNVKKSA